MLGRTFDCGVVENQSLQIRPILEDHLPQFVNWYSDPIVTRYIYSLHAVSASDQVGWYERIKTDLTVYAWSIVLGERLIGWTKIAQIDSITQTGSGGILIGERSYWNKGVATAVMSKRAEFAFQELNLHALFAEILVDNISSLKAADKVGYQEYGIRPFAKVIDGAYVSAWLGVLERETWRQQVGR